MREIPDFDDREWNPPDDELCKHQRAGYCFDCALDGKYDDYDDIDED